MSRIIDSVLLTVAPGEPDDPHRAKAFDLTWWEKFGEPKEAEQTRGSWSFCRKRLGIEGRQLVGCSWHDPKVLRTIAGDRRYSFVLGNRLEGLTA